jgi:hypothetical protein
MSNTLGTTAVTSLKAATANGNGAPADFRVARLNVAMQVVLTGAPSGGTVTLVGSLDGVNWSAALATFTIGTDTNGDIKVSTGKPVIKARAVLAGLTGGTSPTVTALLAAY